MWGSAQADRSITASGSLPRTPSPAYGHGPRLFRAAAATLRSHGSLSRLPPEPPDPRSGPPPSRRTAGLRTSGLPSTGSGDGALRSPALPLPPGFGPPGSSEPGSPLPASATHSAEARRSPERWNRLEGLGDGALRSPALPRPRTWPPGSSEPARHLRQDRHPPSGAWSPFPRLVARSYAPRVSGDRGRCGHRLRPALPHRAGR
jgi:hypothetical protein